MLQLILLVGNTNAPTFAHSPHRQSFKSWGDLVWDMIWAVAEIDREQGSGKRYRLEISDSDEPCMKLLKFRPAEDEARQALPRQIRAELQAARTS
jgi:hypothetical protein